MMNEEEEGENDRCLSPFVVAINGLGCLLSLSGAAWINVLYAMIKFTIVLPACPSHPYHLPQREWTRSRKGSEGR